MLKTNPYSRVFVGIVSASLLIASSVLGEGNDTLAEVAARGNIAEVQRLLDAGVPVNSRQTGTGWTPLISAIRAGRADVAKLLLDRGANPNVAGSTGYTPLMAATQMRNVGMIRTLLLQGANPDKATPKGLTALMLAAGNKSDTKNQRKDLECVKMLLRGGADPDKKHLSGATALSIATERGAMPVVAYLRRVGVAGSGGSGVATSSPVVATNGTITGSVIYRERVAVSSAAFSVVRLLDIKPKVPVVLAQTVTPFAGRQVPVPFSLSYKGADLAARSNPHFALDARIVASGAALFRTEKPIPALTPESKGKKVTLPLVLTSEDAQARLASEAIVATDKALAQIGSSISGKQTLGEFATSYTATFIGTQLVRIVSNSSQGDYGSRTDRFYFSEGLDTEGFPILRASFLNSRRIARTQAPGNPAQTVVVPGKYENVIQKIILDDAGKAWVATRSVDGQNQNVSDPDVTAARNFSRLVSVEALRAVSKKGGR